jgi:hypothetical protein
MTADKGQLACFLNDLIHATDGAVTDRHTEALIGDVEGQIGAHYGQTPYAADRQCRTRHAYELE